MFSSEHLLLSAPRVISLFAWHADSGIGELEYDVVRPIHKQLATYVFTFICIYVYLYIYIYLYILVHIIYYLYVYTVISPRACASAVTLGRIATG